MANLWEATKNVILKLLHNLGKMARNPSLAGSQRTDSQSGYSGCSTKRKEKMVTWCEYWMIVVDNKHLVLSRSDNKTVVTVRLCKS